MVQKTNKYCNARNDSDVATYQREGENVDTSVAMTIAPQQQQAIEIYNRSPLRPTGSSISRTPINSTSAEEGSDEVSFTSASDFFTPRHSTASVNNSTSTTSNHSELSSFSSTSTINVTTFEHIEPRKDIPRPKSILHRTSRVSFKTRKSTLHLNLKKMVTPPAIKRDRIMTRPPPSSRIPRPAGPRRVPIQELAAAFGDTVVVVSSPKQAKQNMKSKLPIFNSTPVRKFAGDMDISKSISLIEKPSSALNGSTTTSTQTNPQRYSPWAVVSVRPFRIRRRSSIHRQQVKKHISA